MGKRDTVSLNGVLIDADMRSTREEGEIIRIQTDNRQSLVEHFRRDEGAECQNVFSLAENQRRGRTAGEDEIEQHAGTGAGAAAGRHEQHTAGETGAMQRVMHVDHLAGGGIDPAPEAQRLGRGDNLAFGGASQNAARLGSGDWRNGRRHRKSP